MSLQKWFFLSAVAAIALPQVVAANEPAHGIVRISDSAPQGIAVQPASMGGCSTTATMGSPACGCVGGSQGSCLGGCCYGSGCRGCMNGGYGCGHGCGHGCGCNCTLCRLFSPHSCTYSPDHGYSPPAKSPINRVGVQYTSYFPANWYGAAGAPAAPPAAYPVVYQPTDTTQLGYYYQHVPYWTPRADMLPQRPYPPYWHQTAVPNSHSRRLFNCHGHGCNYCNGAGCQYCNGNNCQHGSVDGMIYGTPTQGTTMPAAPAPTPAAPSTEPGNMVPAPASPTPPSAMNWNVRRAGFQP